MPSRQPLIIVGLSMLLPTCADARWSGEVIGIADGDTITVLRDKHPVKIRLHGIDCPERAQPFGKRAHQLTAKLAFRKTASVTVVDKDRYGRLVATVRVGKTNLNKALLHAGLAWWYRRYAPKAKDYATLEKAAKQAKRGLWIDSDPVPPWNWRRQRRRRGHPQSETTRRNRAPDSNPVFFTSYIDL